MGIFSKGILFQFQTSESRNLVFEEASTRG